MMGFVRGCVAIYLLPEMPPGLAGWALVDWNWIRQSSVTKQGELVVLAGSSCTNVNKNWY